MALICFKPKALLIYRICCRLFSFIITDFGLCCTFYIYFPFLVKPEFDFRHLMYHLFPLSASESSYQQTLEEANSSFFDSLFRSCLGVLFLLHFRHC
jgi:hypothetical protein